MIRDISAISTIEIPCSKEDALAIIWDIKNIEKSEVKADAVQVQQETDRHGTYTVQGHFAGIPWHGKFTYDLNDKGFHSVENNAPASGPRIQGGFIVESGQKEACKIIHYEHYKLPRWLVPLKPFIEMYLNWSMKKELLAMKDMILEKHARES